MKDEMKILTTKILPPKSRCTRGCRQSSKTDPSCMARAAIERVIGKTKKVCERDRLGSNSLKYEVI